MLTSARVILRPIRLGMLAGVIALGTMQLAGSSSVDAQAQTTPTLPDPFPVTLNASRAAMPEPFEVQLRASRQALPEPFAVDLTATRQQLPEPFEVRLSASRSGLPEPFEVHLDASRAELPEPFAVLLQAERPRALTKVPQVIGLPLSAAEDRVRKANLDPQPGNRIPADERAMTPDEVYAADPNEGTELTEGARVTLLAFGERPKRPIPNVSGKPLDAARGILTASKFDPGAVSLGDPAPDNIEPGTVMATTPPADTAYPIFSSVGIIVYGPKASPTAPETTTEPAELRMVPSVAGDTPDAARGILEQHGFIPGDVSLGNPAGPTEEPGRVASTLPPEGSEQPKGTVVAMVVHGPRAAEAAPPPAEPPLSEPPSGPLDWPPAFDQQPPVAQPPTIVLPPEGPPEGPPPTTTATSEAHPEWADKWIGVWELTSTSPTVTAAGGGLFPVKQMFQVFRRDGKVWVGWRADLKGRMIDVEPTFTANGISIRGQGIIGGRNEIDLVQVNGVCSGKHRSQKPTMANGRIVGWDTWIDWTTTCRRVPM